MAEIFEKTVGPPAPERNLILGVREIFYQPFEASGWTDLRVGWFLSLTDNSNDDTISGVGGVEADEITYTPPTGLLKTDYALIGLSDRETGTTFCGFSNIGPNHGGDPRYLGSSMLVSSDVGIGTTNAYFWRPKNSMQNNLSLVIINNDDVRMQSGDGSQVHFVQNTAGAGGYATLLTLRFQRPDGTSKSITMSAKRDTILHSADILFNNDPSKAILEANLEALPTTVQTLGPFTMSHAPNSFFVYWPWSTSRLRIHAMGILKAS